VTTVLSETSASDRISRSWQQQFFLGVTVHIKNESCRIFTWLIHMCDTTHSCVPWHIHMRDMDDSIMRTVSHSYAWHVAFMFVAWLMNTPDMTHPMFDMTPRLDGRGLRDGAEKKSRGYRPSNYNQYKRIWFTFWPDFNLWISEFSHEMFTFRKNTSAYEKCTLCCALRML